MSARAGILCLLLAAGPVAPAAASERPVKPILCPENAPEGVRLPERPGCGQGQERGARGARGDGFRDLGEGVRLRVGGRVAAESGWRR